jgi:hypothetical protein
MRRFLISAGLAASEAGGVMMILIIFGLATGARSGAALVDILLFAGIGAWLWWKKSMVAATLMVILVGCEYSVIAYTTGRTNQWLVTYLVIFLVAFAAHASRHHEGLSPRGSTGK